MMANMCFSQSNMLGSTGLKIVNLISYRTLNVNAVPNYRCHVESHFILSHVAGYCKRFT